MDSFIGAIVDSFIGAVVDSAGAVVDSMIGVASAWSLGVFVFPSGFPSWVWWVDSVNACSSSSCGLSRQFVVVLSCLVIVFCLCYSIHCCFFTLSWSPAFGPCSCISSLAPSLASLAVAMSAYDWWWVCLVDWLYCFSVMLFLNMYLVLVCFRRFALAVRPCLGQFIIMFLFLRTCLGSSVAKLSAEFRCIASWLGTSFLCWWGVMNVLLGALSYRWWLFSTLNYLIGSVLTCGGSGKNICWRSAYRSLSSFSSRLRRSSVVSLEVDVDEAIAIDVSVASCGVFFDLLLASLAWSIWVSSY